ncbi:MAG: hypothetical protein GC159_09650 [Phycisphaera sp.]|nr:hypothetical protein [Phycisphaera sp.]
MAKTPQKSALTRSVSFGIPLLIAIALPVVVYVTYSPAAPAPARVVSRPAAAVGDTPTRERVMVAATVVPPSQRQLVQHACDAIGEKIVSVSPPKFPAFSTDAYEVSQMGNITWQITGFLEIPNGFGISPTRPFVVHLRVEDRTHVRATFIEVDGETIFGEPTKRRTF